MPQGLSAKTPICAAGPNGSCIFGSHRPCKPQMSHVFCVAGIGGLSLMPCKHAVCFSATNQITT